MFYKLRNDNALLASATNNVVKHLRDLQDCNAGAHSFLEDNGIAVLGRPQNLLDDPSYKPYGKIYDWSDTEVGASYLSDEVDLQSIAETMQNNKNFASFRSYIDEASEQLLKIVPYIKENTGEDGKATSSVNIGVRLTAHSEEDFFEGLSNIRDWDQSNNSHNFRNDRIDENKDFSLFNHD